MPYRSQPNTCEVTGRTPEGKRVRILVHGRAAQVRARILAKVEAGAQSMTFVNVETGGEVRVSLAGGSKVAVN